MKSFVFFWSKKRILRNNRLTTCFVLMFLVFIPLVFALVFSQSMIKGISEKYIYLSNGHITTNIKPEDSQNIAQSIDPVKSGYAVAYSADQTANLMIKGVPENYFTGKRLEQLSFTEDKVQTKLNKITISQTTADKLKIKAGDNIALMVVPNQSKAKVRPVLVTVDKIYSSGYRQLDSNLAYVDFEFAKTLFNDPEYYEIILSDKYSVYPAESAIRMGLNSFLTWQESNMAVYSNFITSSQLIMIILLLVVAIAAFYTAMVSNQLINDDLNEIARLKLLGLSDRDVIKSGFVSVFAIAVTGMLAGSGVGLVLSYALCPLLTRLSKSGLDMFAYYLLEFDIVIPWADIIILLAAMVVLSSAAIVISLKKTKKISPLQLFIQS